MTRRGISPCGGPEYTYDALGALRNIDENSTHLAMTYDANGRLDKLVEGAETRHLITEDFEWLQTSELSRIQIHLAGAVIASHEQRYIPTGTPSCAVSPPALDGGWGAPLGLFTPGLCAFLVLQAGFALRRRPRGKRLRPVLAAGTAGVFLAAVSVPFPGVVNEARAADPTGVTYYHGDHLESSVVITDEYGNDVRRLVYRPFGQAAPGSDLPVPEFGFTGQRFVDSLDIYDYGARWYDPELGRFLQPDPVISDISNPQTINPYSYVANSPLNYIDPTGMNLFEFSLTEDVWQYDPFWDSDFPIYDPVPVGLSLPPGMLQPLPGATHVEPGTNPFRPPSQSGAAAASSPGFSWNPLGLLANDVLSAIYGFGFGNGLGIVGGFGTALGGALTGSWSMMKSGVGMLGNALVPRFGFNSGPGHGYGSLTPRTVIDWATRIHDQAYARLSSQGIGMFSPRTTPADKQLIRNIWSSHALGPIGQVYRVGLTAAFGLKIGAQEGLGAIGVVR